MCRTKREIIPVKQEGIYRNKWLVGTPWNVFLSFKGPVIIYRRGEEDLSLNKVKFRWNLAYPSFVRYFTFAMPSPHVFIFQADLSGPTPLNPSKVFSDPPFWVLSYDWSPVCCSKNQVTPPKILRPPPML